MQVSEEIFMSMYGVRNNLCVACVHRVDLAELCTLEICAPRPTRREDGEQLSSPRRHLRLVLSGVYPATKYDDYDFCTAFISK